MYRLLYSHEFMALLRSRAIARFATWNAILTFSEQCVAKLVLLLYFVSLH